jgi:TPR repeat protein
LTLPKTATGQRALSIELIAADGTTIATAATRLDVATKLRGATVLRPAEAEHIDNLISHGQRMVDLGYFAGARAFFKRAAEAGSGEAALALGTTYDPALIAEIGAQGIEPEPREARIWYERAKDLGAQDAEAKLKALESATHETAASAIPETSVPATDDTSSETVPVSSERQEWIELSGAANLTVVPSSSAPDN